MGAILAFNLNAAMKRLALGERWAAKRMKALRFHLIGLPGRVVGHARRLIIRLGGGAEALATLLRRPPKDPGAGAGTGRMSPNRALNEPGPDIARRSLARRRRPAPASGEPDSPRLHAVIAGLAMRVDEPQEVIDPSGL